LPLGTALGLFVPVGAVGVGLLWFSMYSTALYGAAEPMVSAVSAGALFPVALVGQLVGTLALGPLWNKLPQRVMGALVLAGSAVASVLFGVSAGFVPGYYLAAGLAGLAGSGNFALFVAIQDHVSGSVALEWSRGSARV
jgi:hypothetical protein